MTISRRSIRHGIHKGLYWTGAAGLYVRLARAAGTVILMYHSIPSAKLAPWIDPANAMAPECFEEQMRFLHERRRVISMDELVKTVREGRTNEAGTVAITFDDGYLDNLEVAAPILAHYQLPATLYLATTYINNAKPQWIDELYCRVKSRTGDVELDVAALKAQLLGATYLEREQVLSQLASSLRPGATIPRLTLSWGDVREMTVRYPNIEIAAHTADHVDLRACSADQVHQQLSRCVADIEREIGRRPKHFSFPYGRGSPEARQLLADLGFDSAVIGGEQVLIRAGRDVHALPRVESPSSMGLLRFWTSGAYPGLPAKVLGRL